MLIETTGFLRMHNMTKETILNRIAGCPWWEWAGILFGKWEPTVQIQKDALNDKQEIYLDIE